MSCKKILKKLLSINETLGQATNFVYEKKNEKTKLICIFFFKYEISDVYEFLETKETLK